MARNTVITITDDIDGTGNAEQYSFAYDGQAYTIDLSKKNKTGMDKALKPYLDVATKVRAPRSGRASRSANARGGRRRDLAQVREWARSNNYDISDRGRISASITQAYDAAH